MVNFLINYMENNMNKFLFCIDAGFTHTGMSLFKVNDGKFIFEKAYTVVTEKSSKKKQLRVADDDAERTKLIIKGINEFIKEYETDKIMAAVELPHGGARGARAIRTMGIVAGAIVTYLEMKNWPAEYVTPDDVKLAVAGNKKASKDEIMEKVRKILIEHKHKLPKTKNEFEHIADSIGVALHIKKHSEMFKMLIK